jgi:hypothetical protein
VVCTVYVLCSVVPGRASGGRHRPTVVVKEWSATIMCGRGNEAANTRPTRPTAAFEWCAGASWSRGHRRMPWACTVSGRSFFPGRLPHHVSALPPPTRPSFVLLSPSVFQCGLMLWKCTVGSLRRCLVDVHRRMEESDHNLYNVYTRVTW